MIKERLMIDSINSWVQGIIIAVIISTIIEMILPEGTIKKYVRTVIGTYIVFVIASPIISKITGKEIDLSSYKLPETKITQTTAIDTNAYIENTYINKIKEDIIKNIETKGYKVAKVEIYIDEDNENYGSIKSISVNISKNNSTSDNATINKIEPIKVDIKNETIQNENISEQEINELKTYLEENYGTDIEKIKINQQ